MSEYRRKFPGKIVQKLSDEQKLKLSSYMKKKLQDPQERKKFLDWRSFPSEIKHWTRKGFSIDDARKKVFEFQQKQSLKGNNEKTRLLRSRKNSGSNNPMSLESIAFRNNVSLDDASKLTPCYGRSGTKHPFFGKKHTIEALKKISSAPHLLTPNFRSKGELELESFCNKIEHVNHNVRIGKWNIDIAFENKPLLIEFFGDFWHMNPSTYKKDDIHPVMKCFAQHIWERDNKKISCLRDKGFEVLVIWENDWNNDKESSLQRIKDAYDRIC